MDAIQVCEVFRGIARRLASIDVGELDGDGVRAAVDGFRSVHSQVTRIDVALASRAGELRPTGSCDDPVDLLTGVGAMASGDARKVVRNSELLAAMPALRAALQSGTVGEGHVDVVAIARRRIDPAARAKLADLDGEIADYARTHTPDQLAEHLRWVQIKLERPVAHDLDERRRRAARVRTWVDQRGEYQLHGNFDPEMGARIFTAVDSAVEALRKKNPISLVPGDNPRDPLANDREFLAAHALARLVSQGHMNERPGIPEVVVLVDETTLVEGVHPGSVCELHDGTAFDPDRLHRLCCDALVTAVVTSANGRVPLDVGRSQRTANRAQRRALRAVHRTCAIEGCESPFDWCEIHHVQFWESRGPTDLDNLVPLCLRHHHLVHDSRWRLSLRPSDRMLTARRADGTIVCETPPPGLRLEPGPGGVTSTWLSATAYGAGPPGDVCTTAA